MLITVFTPTYNRVHLLPRLYDSLCRQTYKDFEWVVVDDGSTDGTRTLFEESSAIFHDETEEQENSVLKHFKEGNGISSIRYFHQKNGGKHRAINRGVKEAKGELFFILDSDDSLPPDALERVNYYYQQIKDDMSFGGVCGYMAHHDGTIIGHGCELPMIDTNTIDLRNKYHVQGDMMEVFRTSVMRMVPFPEIPGERFCPEVLVWNRIAANYKLRVFHEVIYYRDYLDGGLTDKIVRIRMQSPIASMMTYSEMTCYKDVPLAQKVKAAINYWRFRFCNKGNRDIPRMAWYWNVLMPLGWLMHKRDKAHMLN